MKLAIAFACLQAILSNPSSALASKRAGHRGDYLCQHEIQQSLASYYFGKTVKVSAVRFDAGHETFGANYPWSLIETTYTVEGSGETREELFVNLDTCFCNF